MAQTWLEKYSTYEDEVTGSATGITAYAGGGQANATALTSKYNNVTISATNGDSVKLPSALAGKRVYVLNSDAAQTIAVYCITGDYMNNTINSFKTLNAGQGGIFECIFNGYWVSFVSA